MNLDKEILKVLSNEASAILNVKLGLDGSVSTAIKLVVKTTNSGHNIFVSGMGKCSFIAGKLAATYSSLGIPSFYLNCSHALHGDIGAVREGDLAIVLSKSGSTTEVIELVKALNEFKVNTILITCTYDSELSDICGMTIVVPVSKEACHLNLAPTTSTTVMMAVGDAIGVVSSKLLGFEIKDFNKRHPKGRLGELSNEGTNSPANI